jgi:hypothetical protein
MIVSIVLKFIRCLSVVCYNLEYLRACGARNMECGVWPWTCWAMLSGRVQLVLHFSVPYMFIVHYYIGYGTVLVPYQYFFPLIKILLVHRTFKGGNLFLLHLSGCCIC